MTEKRIIREKLLKIFQSPIFNIEIDEDTIIEKEPENLEIIKVKDKKSDEEFEISFDYMENDIVNFKSSYFIGTFDFKTGIIELQKTLILLGDLAIPDKKKTIIKLKNYEDNDNFEIESIKDNDSFVDLIINSTINEINESKKLIPKKAKIYAKTGKLTTKIKMLDNGRQTVTFYNQNESCDKNLKKFKIIYDETEPFGFTFPENTNITIKEAREIIEKIILDSISQPGINETLNISIENNYGVLTCEIRDMFLLLNSQYIQNENECITSLKETNKKIFLLTQERCKYYLEHPDELYQKLSCLKEEEYEKSTSTEESDTIEEYSLSDTSSNHNNESDYILIPSITLKSPHSILLVIPKDPTKKIIVVDSLHAVKKRKKDESEESELTELKEDELSKIADRGVLLNSKIQQSGTCTTHTFAYSIAIEKEKEYKDIIEKFGFNQDLEKVSEDKISKEEMEILRKKIIDKLGNDLEVLFFNMEVLENSEKKLEDFRRIYMNIHGEEKNKDLVESIGKHLKRLNKERNKKRKKNSRYTDDDVGCCCFC